MSILLGGDIIFINNNKNDNNNNNNSSVGRKTKTFSIPHLLEQHHVL